jgi:hypothetical protein
VALQLVADCFKIWPRVANAMRNWRMPLIKYSLVCRVSGGSGRSSDKTGAWWSGEASKNMVFGATENQIKISMDARSGATVTPKPAKEVPLWISQSTVEGAEITEPQNMVMFRFVCNLTLLHYT